ncbi:phosphoribosylglycinamide formyltransferase [Cryptococcus wingfieldii CBS 7118]|uniref:phosphoribosylglycinamide formyltransferase 1 n=1 Tax=Cryptococcus wingfieldii CBS 7118 TaxID=1295528 RepID=A0A1E3K4Z9_9TREE|nr:phosphoribosylglycinamide formyltransferase [Cryptococcus wingfieldii CBS 7118]ODO07322.1 phosphoribosylglycinamide formyltransferase [Cryptococcus wingfieldii CBS 7118]
MSATETTPRTRRITVLISGSGTNLQALLDAAGTPRLPNAAITTVISSRSNAFGLTRARTHSPPIPTSVCALKTFQNRNPGATREHYDAEVARQVLESKPDMVVLAGWMHILSDRFLDILDGKKEPPSAPALPPPAPSSAPTQAKPTPSNPTTAPVSSLPEPPATQTFPIPIINLHPALPGAFDGAHAIERTLEAFKQGVVKCAGVMVHRVVAEVDRGEPLLVREVEIKQEDKLEDLEERIHGVEHGIIVDGARLILEQLDKEQ